MDGLQLLSEICSLPTAPFAEQLVVRHIERFVEQRPALRLQRDRFDNLLIELQTQSTLPRWVFTAHMDHPGMIAKEMVDPQTLRAAFWGWVKADFIRGAKVRFFDAGREITGVVSSTKVPDNDQRGAPEEVTIQIAGPVTSGSPGMFDLPPAQVDGSRFSSRACDDLAGLAACLAVLDEVMSNPPPAPVAVLLTRAEEEGFIGCIAACEHPSLLRKTDRVLAIECSSVQPVAPQGAGVIIRVGDRTSVFNSGLTYFLGRQADGLKKADADFRYQRALMPGGTCEATVYNIYGYMAASMCVPLGNYHNMDTSRNEIAAEYIDISDWQNMVKLFVQVARQGHEYEPGHAYLKSRVLERYAKLEGLLMTSPI